MELRYKPNINIYLHLGFFLGTEVEEGGGGRLQEPHTKGTHNGEFSTPCHLDIVENVNG